MKAQRRKREQKKKAMPNLSIMEDLRISTHYDTECSKVIIMIALYFCMHLFVHYYVDDRQAHVLIFYLLLLLHHLQIIIHFDRYMLRNHTKSFLIKMIIKLTNNRRNNNYFSW
jgi:hypothetical protein